MQKVNKKTGKVLLWTAVILVGVGFLINVVARQQLKSALNAIPGAEVQVSRVHLSLLAGNVHLRDVAFTLRDTTDAGPDIEGNIQSLKPAHPGARSSHPPQSPPKRGTGHHPATRILPKKSLPWRA